MRSGRRAYFLSRQLCLGSVDRWPDGQNYHKVSGDTYSLVLPCTIGERSPLGACKLHRVLLAVDVCGGPGPGEFRGENWKAVRCDGPCPER
jgi:hypothetical protein